MPIAAALPAIIGAVATTGGALVASNAAKKAAESAGGSGGAGGQLDLGNIQSQVLAQSQQNAATSNALEQQYNPGINALRQLSAGNLLQLLQQGNTVNPALQSSLLNQFNNPQSVPAQSALSQSAQAAAQKNMQNPYALPVDVVNLTLRLGASQAGSMGGPGGGLGLGRDLGARDLGLNSLQLYQQNLANAQSLGGQADQYGLQGFGLGQQALVNQANLGYGIANLGQQNFNNILGTSQFTQGVAQPQSGLSPSSVANILAGNSNAAFAAAQQAAAIKAGQGNALIGLGGNILGSGALNGLGNIFGGGSGANQPAINNLVQAQGLT